MKNSGPGPRHSSRGSLQRGPEPEGGCNRRKPRPSSHSSHGSAAAGVTKITAFRFAGTRAECCDMLLFRNNRLKKITDQFAALSVWGSYVRLRI
jgi:hypothetical protein